MCCRLIGAILSSFLLLVGCEHHEDGLITGSVGEDDAKVHGTPPLDPEAEGRRHFAAGHYGLAEHKYRMAVEARADNASAWIGLAASYDQLRRFDLARRAYDRALAIQGRSPLLLNNLGYHYYLQGDKAKAEQSWRSAAQLEPGNSKILANLELLAAKAQ